MPGVGKLLKQAQKMQKSMEAMEARMDGKEIEVSAAGGAIKLRITGSGKFTSLTLDPEFLKEDPKLVADTLLAAMQDASKQAKDQHDAEMQKITSGFQMPGFM